MPRYFLFGLWRVQMYEYYWGHTAAQIDLIDFDQPITVYKKHDENENGSGHGLKPGDKGYKPNKKKLDAAVERWQKRKAAREARGFDLGKLLRTGEKVPVDKDNSQTT